MHILDNNPLTNEELELLDQLILNYANEEDDKGIISLSELDGYLTAIISSPKLIKPSEWLPGIWGNEPPEWKNEEQAQFFFNLLFRYYNEISRSLRSGFENYAPLFNYFGEEEYPVVDDWCFGYIYATKIANWQKLPNKIQPYFDFIQLQTVIDDAPSLKEQQKIEQAVRQAAFEIYRCTISTI